MECNIRQLLTLKKRCVDYMQFLAKFMEENSLFSSFTVEERDTLIAEAEKVFLEKGEYLHFNGGDFPYIFILSDGLLYAKKELINGRSVIMKKFNVGDVFLGHAVFAQRPTPATLVAFRPSTIYRWHRANILPLFRNNKEALWQMCCKLNERSLEVRNIIEDFSSSSVGSRLARLLVSEFETLDEDCIPRNMTLEEIASSVGSTKEVVCRYLRRMSDENLIQVERDRFILINKIELTELADGEIVSNKSW